MSRGLRILHIADSHIGAGMPDRPRKSGRRRGDDIIDSYCRVLQRAREFDVDLVLHAGDVFDRPDPSPSLIAVACEPLLSLAADGIPVVVTPGNHERSILPNSLLLSHQNVYILARPRTIVLKLRGCRVAVTGMPCIRRQSAQRFPAALAEANWEAAKADCRVLLLHQTIESATCGPAGYRFRSGEDVIERHAIPAAFDYVALGHIHRMQCLEPTLFDGAPLVYAGSPDRISFAERDEPKGCMLVEERGGGLSARFLEHDVRPMRIVALDVTGLRRDELVNAVSESVASLPPRALARVRLTGRATRDVVRGLRLARHCCELRPDASVAVSMEAVEFVPNRALRRLNEARGGAAFAAFAAFESTAGPVTSVDVENLPSLADAIGTYALYDAAARLLYIGKAKRVRTRVRSHLRGGAVAAHYSGWTQRIARVVVRPASSELEALLVEAEAIRTQRPPFNRQMRLWSRYCYLCETNLPYGQLSVCVEPAEAGRSFGPFRSRMSAREVVEAVAEAFGTAHCPEAGGRRSPVASGGASALCERYFDGRCCGVCGGKATAAEYAERIAARDALLTGTDDAVAAYWERQFAAAEARDPDDPRTRAIGRLAATLRATYEHCAVLRAAESLVGGVLIMPCDDDARVLVEFGDDRLRISRFAPSRSAVARVVRAASRVSGGGTASPRGRIAKARVDLLVTVVRHLRRHPSDATVITAEQLRNASSADVVKIVRAGAPGESVDAVAIGVARRACVPRAGGLSSP